MTAEASPLPTFESDSFQSRLNDKRDGIIIWEEEVITIYFGSYVWIGRIFEELGVKGLFLEGQDWEEVDLRKG